MYRESLETVQHVDSGEIPGVRQDTRSAKWMPTARKMPNRSKSTGFRLGRQQGIWCLHPGRARPGLIEAVRYRARKTCRHGIRGARAPASLKRAPASLKLAQGIGFSRSLSMHPGRARPGLIEAVPRPARPHRPRGIRGARAPASLKRRGSRFRTSVARRIRGARAPASLKPELHPCLSHRARGIRGARADLIETQEGCVALRRGTPRPLSPCHRGRIGGFARRSAQCGSRFRLSGLVSGHRSEALRGQCVVSP